jgi:hypothetical protein
MARTVKTLSLSLEGEGEGEKHGATCIALCHPKGKNGDRTCRVGVFII